MKNLNRHPLSCFVPRNDKYTIFILKMAILMLVLLNDNHINAQNLTLVKDINTPLIADLKNAIVYPVGNKIYYSDGTANGTKVAYTGAANATILSNSDIYQNQLLAYFFVEQTPTSAKALRYNKTRVEVLTQGTTVTHFMTYFGQFRYVVNGNQLWAATYNTGPTLIKTFASPIKELKDNFVFTTNSVWLIDYPLGTSTLLKDGFTDIGATNGSLFAANDGGFNGTELWTATSPPNAYMLRDLNPGTASSNPRNFLGNYFCATSEGQNWLYYYDYTTVKRLIATPIGTEIKPISVFYGYSQYGQSANFIVYTEKTGSTFYVYAAQVDTPSIRTIIYAGTEGDIVFTPSLYNIFTHVHSNGTRDIWQFAYANAAELIVPNASLDNQYGGLRVVAGDDGKLWRMEFDNTNQRYNRALIKDFGAAKLQIQGITTLSTPSIYRSELIITSTLAGNTTTNTLNISDQIPSNIRDVATVTLPTSEYSSFPNSFVEINGKILFNATDGENGEELWRTDGTTSSTTLFKAFSEGPYGNVGKSFKDNGFVYYENKNLSGDKTTYWKTDGATIDSIRSTTAEYQTIKNKFNQGQTYPNLTVGTTKYQTYYATYPLCNRCPSAYIGGIQRIVGTDTSFVFSFSYQSAYAAPISSLQTIGSRIYFTFNQVLTGSNSDNRGALWGSDGTAAGTTIIKTFSKRPSDIVVVNGKMYFTADDGINGLALWTSDGTAAGTKVVANFSFASPVPLDVEVSKIYAQGNSLYFILSQLYTRNGTSLYGYRIGGTGMSKIMDLTNDFFAPAQNGIQVNGNLYLAQTNATVGTELFKLALTEAPLGGPLSNQSDLALTQTVTTSSNLDSLIYTFDVTVTNKGGQTATNVKTNFDNLRNSNYYDESFWRDTVVSLGFLSGRYDFQKYWLIPSLGVNQTATLHFRVPINKSFQFINTIYTTTKSDQFDGDITNNFAEFTKQSTVEPCTGPVAGKLRVDYYLNQITDASPIVIQSPNAPSGQYLASGTIGYNFNDQYIRRARGYLKPTETGNYQFFIAGDDNVDVYLSTDDNPTNKQRIAYVKGYTSLFEFNKFASQTSVSINLVAGRRYYLEIVNADKFGDDTYNLQWATPSVFSRNLIPNEAVEWFCGDPVIVALPDLTLENLTIVTRSVSAGQDLAYKVTAKNIGTANAGIPNVTSIYVLSYLSLDQTLDANDYQRGSIAIPILNAGETRSNVSGEMNTFGLTAGNYYLILKIDDDNTINESNENNNILVSTSTITVTAVNTSTFCASKGVAPWEYAISNVTLNTLNNNSDKFKDFNTLGYSDFTNLSTTLTKGQTYPLSITPLLSWIGNLPNAYCRVWIDFNQNKTFEANELVLEKTNQNPFTQSITVPTTATLGNTRMRVSLKFGAYPTACEAFDKGEVEDYAIQINEGTSNDIALTITSTPSVYRQYTIQSFKIIAKNLGNQAFTNVKIKFRRPDLTVSGGTKIASIGSFQEYCPNNVECWEWTIPTLAGGVTATLDIPVYVLNPVNTIGATATLLSSNPVDNIVANNTTVVLINQAITPAVQPLIQSKPTQLIPVVIQRIAPTITENYIVVELESIVDKQVEFEIINSLGTVVLIEKIRIEKGNNKRQFDVSQLPKGLYFIQTSVGKGRNVPTKFVKF